MNRYPKGARMNHKSKHASVAEEPLIIINTDDLNVSNENNSLRTRRTIMDGLHPKWSRDYANPSITPAIDVKIGCPKYPYEGIPPFPSMCEVFVVEYSMSGGKRTSCSSSFMVDYVIHGKLLQTGSLCGSVVIDRQMFMRVVRDHFGYIYHRVPPAASCQFTYELTEEIQRCMDIVRHPGHQGLLLSGHSMFKCDSPYNDAWFEKRKRQLLLGSGFSSDSIGDGPSSTRSFMVDSRKQHGKLGQNRGSHPTGPCGICFDFWYKKGCDKHANCKYMHDTPKAREIIVEHGDDPNLLRPPRHRSPSSDALFAIVDDMSTPPPLPPPNPIRAVPREPRVEEDYSELAKGRVYYNVPQHIMDRFAEHGWMVKSAYARAVFWKRVVDYFIIFVVSMFVLVNCLPFIIRQFLILISRIHFFSKPSMALVYGLKPRTVFYDVSISRLIIMGFVVVFVIVAYEFTRLPSRKSATDYTGQFEVTPLTLCDLKSGLYHPIDMNNNYNVYRDGDYSPKLLAKLTTEFISWSNSDRVMSSLRHEIRQQYGKLSYEVCEHTLGMFKNRLEKSEVRNQMFPGSPKLAVY